MSHTSSASHSADVLRERGLGKSRKTQDQKSLGRARSTILVMPKRQRSADPRTRYGWAAGLSGLGLLLGLVAVQSFPLAGCLAVLTAIAGLLYSSVEFWPLARPIRTPIKEMKDGGRRPR